MATVSDTQMQSYLEGFHRVYQETVDDKLPADLRAHVFRYNYISRGLIAYISTQYGAGYEYDATTTGISMVKGSARVEDLFFGAPSALRRSPPLITVAAEEFGIEGLTIEGTFPIRMRGPKASVRMRDFRAKAGSWERLVDYAELFADRSGDFWSDAMAARRAVEEVLVAVVDAREMERRRLDLSAFLDRYHQRKVLLLGDFRSGRDRLQAIAAELEALGYLPVLADTVEEFPEYDLRQKILLLALVCRFVVVEDSTPAGQLTELPLMEVARKVTVVLRRIGTQSSWMTAGMSESSNVILERRYAAGELSAVVTESVEWAESELERLGAKYDSEFPWRRPTPPAP